MAILRLRYVFVLVCAILLSPFLIFWVWSSIESARLERTFDALEARNEPLDIAAFDPKPANDEQRQASHHYKQAAGLVAELRPRSLTEAGKEIEEYCGTSDPVIRRGRATSLASLEAQYRRALELLDRASSLDANGWDAADKPPRMSIEANLPYQLAGVNAIRIARLACNGDGEAAGNALLASLRLRRILPAWATRPLQTSHSLQLVLQAGASLPLLQQLQQEYEQLAEAPGLDVSLQHTRAQWLYFAEPGAFSDPPQGFEGRRMTPFEAIAMRLLRPARDHVAVSELREFNEVIDAMKQPWPQKLEAARAIDRRYPRSSNRGSLASALMPFGRHAASFSLQLYVATMAEALARTRASIGALAAARWMANHRGALPGSLNDLNPQYISGPLTDPYSGGPLNYTQHGRAYKIYSVGTNHRDDGGMWEQHSDLEFTRRGDPLDVGIAVHESPRSPELP